MTDLNYIIANGSELLNNIFNYVIVIREKGSVKLNGN
jgi:hypothetical protein